MSDAKVLRWARVIQPMMLVGYALFDSWSNPDGHGYGDHANVLPDRYGDGWGGGFEYQDGDGRGFGHGLGLRTHGDGVSRDGR